MQTALGGQQRHPGKCIFHFVGEWPLRPADAKTADVMIRSLNNCAGRGHIQIDKNGNARQMEFITLDRYVPLILTGLRLLHLKIRKKASRISGDNRSDIILIQILDMLLSS